MLALARSGTAGQDISSDWPPTMSCAPWGRSSRGQIVTVEPILEFPEKQMHFRVEDTILITNSAPEILSSDVPTERADIEELLGRAAGK
jgi:hypothetical protein